MKEKNYRKILGKNDNFQNQCALNYLLNYGRNNLLDDNFFNNKIKETEDAYNSQRGSPIMTKDYNIAIIKISREMASMDVKDLYDFIQSEICFVEKIDRETDSPEYDY